MSGPIDKKSTISFAERFSNMSRADRREVLKFLSNQERKRLNDLQKHKRSNDLKKKKSPSSFNKSRYSSWVQKQIGSAGKPESDLTPTAQVFVQSLVSDGQTTKGAGQARDVARFKKQGGQ